MPRKTFKGTACVQGLKVSQGFNERFCETKAIDAELITTSQVSADHFTQLKMENWRLQRRAVELELEIKALEERISQ